MLCRAIPYEGNEPYIFLSYSHKDAPRVYPLLEQMVRDGYRIWYDDGNHPGDDWLENIAGHLNHCRVCIAMLSANTGASHNCRNEVNLAIELNKKLMAVQLEQFDMPLGMRLQLGTIHYLKQYEYPSAHMLLEKLYETEGLKECLAGAGMLPMRTIAEQVPAAEEEPNPILEEFVNAERRPAVMKAQIVPLPEEAPAQEAVEEAPAAEQPKEENPPRKKKVKKVVAKVKTVPVGKEAEPEVTPEPVAEAIPESAVQAVPEMVYEESRQEDWEEEKTVYVPKTPAPSEEEADDGESTVRANQQKTMVLLRLSCGKSYVLQSALTRIGRSERRCDIVLADNPSISNHHADIIQYNGNCYLHDAGSSNGTFVNGERMEREGQLRLESPAMFYLYNEPFLLIAGETAEQLIRDGKAYLLRSEKTGLVKLVDSTPMLLDRKHKWDDGTLEDNQISRQKHAWILMKDGEAFLEDRDSTNGTYLNERRIGAGECCELKAGDKIRLGETVLEVGIAAL